MLFFLPAKSDQQLVITRTAVLVHTFTASFRCGKTKRINLKSLFLLFCKASLHTSLRHLIT